MKLCVSSYRIHFNLSTTDCWVVISVRETVQGALVWVTLHAGVLTVANTSAHLRWGSWRSLAVIFPVQSSCLSVGPYQILFIFPHNLEPHIQENDLSSDILSTACSASHGKHSQHCGKRSNAVHLEVTGPKGKYSALGVALAIGPMTKINGAQMGFN